MLANQNNWDSEYSFRSFHSHPGCECGDLFYGPHCEFLKSANQLAPAFVDVSPGGVESQHDFLRYGIISLMLLVIFGVSSVVGLFGLKWWRRRKARIRQTKHEEFMKMDLHSFRDENPGALSANGNMLFPSAAPVARSSTGNMLFPAHPANAAPSLRNNEFDRGGLYDVEVI